MAGSLVSRAALIDRVGSFFRFSFSFLRNLSASSASSAEPGRTKPTKPRRKKKKNLFEVAQFLPGMSAITWPKPIGPMSPMKLPKLIFTRMVGMGKLGPSL